jgi:hypothetical protein
MVEGISIPSDKLVDAREVLPSPKENENGFGARERGDIEGGGTIDREGGGEQTAPPSRISSERVREGAIGLVKSATLNQCAVFRNVSRGVGFMPVRLLLVCRNEMK